MLAVTAARFAPDAPLSALEVGERPEPEVPDGWVLVDLKAAAVNHHDLWSLRGVGLTEAQLPMVLGCDGAGTDPEGNEVVVHAVIGDPDAGDGDETLDPRRSLLSERHPGTLAERVAVPRRNLVPKPAGMSWEQAACLPTAYLTAYRMLFTRGELRPGDTVLVQGAGGGVATALILLARAAGLRVWATSRHADKREHTFGHRGAPGLRERGAPARQGRRRHGDRRRSHLEPLPAIAAARRRPGGRRGDERQRSECRPGAGLLPAAIGDRLDDGHTTRTRSSHHLL